MQKWKLGAAVSLIIGFVYYYGVDWMASILAYTAAALAITVIALAGENTISNTLMKLSIWVESVKPSTPVQTPAVAQVKPIVQTAPPVQTPRRGRPPKAAVQATPVVN